MSTAPNWPSLYNPVVEFRHIAHHPPIEPGGVYLHNANDIFRFTFYWSLILYFPLYALSGSYAVLTIVAAPAPTVVAKSSVPAETSVPELGEQQVHAHRSRSWPWTRFSIRRSRVHLPPHMHRTRALYALIVLLTYLSAGLLGAVLGSAVLGYVAAALFKAGRFDMSTWIPPTFALLQALIELLGVYPSFVEIM